MGLFNWLTRFFTGERNDTRSHSYSSATDDFPTVNPATGLPMVNGIGSVDVGGNPFGTDLSARYHDELSISHFDNDSLSSSLGSSSINPANGLPMIDGTGSVDVLGNPYGTDSHDSFSSGIGLHDDPFDSFSSGSGLSNDPFDSFSSGSGLSSDPFDSFGGTGSSFDDW
ncbi:hypothetical protein GZ77_05300 [Endozoicomonas montiporae]|uniref:Uncharacterized protein n=2 Tax=Endozoicomonas montiporae TaxID=1027273 RepID=A0A081NBU6_9GAMM|nr:hypothetical protein [Endozoicomonas montiporae]AMO56229.1 hypothetical protein EZMO1_2112 [Endozoicomonas montiporae CL-33]KEQ15919.1 hypothetical protein GZ77_05300 [Endozoicomonas montiporae]